MGLTLTYLSWSPLLTWLWSKITSCSYWLLLLRERDLLAYFTVLGKSMLPVSSLLSHASSNQRVCGPGEPLQRTHLTFPSTDGAPARWQALEGMQTRLAPAGPGQPRARFHLHFMWGQSAALLFDGPRLPSLWKSCHHSLSGAFYYRHFCSDIPCKGMHSSRLANGLCSESQPEIHIPIDTMGCSTARAQIRRRAKFLWPVN